MTPQEQQMLQDLTARVNSTQLPEKDVQAEQFLAQTLGRNPDALYILSQTTLVQQYAVDQAQKQIADLKSQVDQLTQQLQQSQQAPKHTSFLGSLLGHDDPPPNQPAQPQFAPVNDPRPGSYYGQGNAPQYGGQQYPPSPQYQQQPPYGYPQPPQYGAPQYGAPQAGGFQSGGFLQSAMKTAAIVGAGALAFEGVESLVHGFEHHGGSNFGSFGDSNSSRPEEVVNNYYGDSSPREHESHLSDSNDIEDRRGFADSSDDNDKDTSDDFSQSDTDDSSDSSDDTSDDSNY